MSEGTYSEVKDKLSENKTSIMLLNSYEESKSDTCNSKNNKWKKNYGTESIDFININYKALRELEEKKDGN